jgi:hypothetical protein
LLTVGCTQITCQGHQRHQHIQHAGGDPFLSLGHLEWKLARYD